MGRNYLAHASGDGINGILAAAGCNFSLLITWLRLLWLRLLIVQRARVPFHVAIRRFGTPHWIRNSSGVFPSCMVRGSGITKALGRLGHN